MSVIRHDPTTKEWVIIATERGERPHDFKKEDRARVLSLREPSCPFYSGNEAKTPLEILRIPDREGDGWAVRVVPNKFAALTAQGEPRTREDGPLFREMDGVGHYEVIIETPIHNQFLPLMEDSEVEQVVHAYRERYLALRQDKRVKLILIFKNHGEAAGTSLEHPHSQLVATPVLPASIRHRYDVAIQYDTATGRCLHCDIVEAERKAGERVVFETDDFLVFHRFVSGSPYETWIAPKRHRPSFGQIMLEECQALAVVLKTTLTRLGNALNDPDYNFVIYTAPVGDEEREYYLWHIQILPRLTTVAGFEIGSGMRINIAKPEETAMFVREISTTAWCFTRTP
ncbi:MAG: galactose-1-phosphate uridylyltransferase [Candidatus Methylomirabilales bacterium]